MQVFADAFERAGNFDKETVRDAISATKMETFYGNIEFDETGRALFEALRQYRLEIARAEGVPPYVVATDRAAVARAAQDRPDLILMDLVMPEMDGVEATRRIMAETPCPILVVTATVEGNARKVVAALGHGAVEHQQSDEGGLFDIGQHGAFDLEDMVAEFEVARDNDLEGERAVRRRRGRAEVRR